ncbi:NADPH-dependent F420 reductase [Anaeromyxobacter diazotrophicus]|uniref:3-hydroxyisobutyrate dehydrogenase n=1 Tax=Anaeromyxobacter diazotrophicus TaxID=2590199 RepID=A0A7I9VKB2_9BACT|nr:3-hydroxyisobutyrate dehydrogenase [Anaeromyxobacter diazotrophicus]
MRVGIIGSGHIGGTAARLFAEAGHEVALSHAGPPDALRDAVAKLGPNAHAATVEEAARFGDVVLLALPWRSRGALPARALDGKVVVDATNPYGADGKVEDLGDATSSEEVLKVIPRSRLVKAMNTLFAQDLASRGRKDLPLPERTVLLMAGDDEDAKQVVAELIRDIGYAAVDLGELREGGKLQQPGSPLYAKTLRASEVPAALGMEGGEGDEPQPGPR